jgi:hypothetical protein
MANRFVGRREIAKILLNGQGNMVFQLKCGDSIICNRPDRDEAAVFGAELMKAGIECQG